MISPDTIDRIRERTSLVRVVGETLKLERRGRSYVGLCPFHKEKSPSFHVNDERGFFHCFGCHAAGDVFKFVQETSGLSFVEVVRLLGEKAGIQVEDDLTDAERRQRAAQKKREDNLYQVNAIAAAYFEKMLGSHRHSRFAHDELKKRDLPYDGPAAAVLKSFHVGYAPDGWDGLATHLESHGVDLRAAEAVGLLAPRKQGSGYYDRFRHRLMFSVIDLQGRVVAFSGRALTPAEPPSGDAEPPAKYINSPESPIYRKRETVFGLFQARTALRNAEPCVLVEGNFDVVSLHARGCASAVAPLGTAFTVEQGRQIRRFTTDVVFLFDGDSAGRKAVRASRQPAKDAGLVARVARLPDGMDPDDFSRVRGADALKNLINASQSMLEHLVAEVLNAPFKDGDAHLQTRQLNELIESEDDPTARAMAKRFTDQLAARLRVADTHTQQALDSSVPVGANDWSSVQAKQTSSLPTRPARLQQSRSREHEIDMAILGALLDYPELLDSAEFLAYSGVMQGDLAAAVAILRKARPTGTTPSEGALSSLTLAKMPETVRAFALARMAAPVHSDVELAWTELMSNLKLTEKRVLKRQDAETQSELERAHSEGNQDQEFELLMALQLRAQQRRGL